MNCTWDENNVCNTCLRPAAVPGYSRNCRGAPRTNPGTVQRVLNFGKAAAAHAAAGFPLCTPDEVAAREVACNACPLLVGGVCTHFNCGCPTTRFENWKLKTSWADSVCPLDRWPKSAWQQSNQPG